MIQNLENHRASKTMTLAYWCVLIGGLMPILWTGIAKFTGSRRLGPVANKSPREFLETVEGHQKRAHWAQQNAFEAFPIFAAAVIVAHLTGGAQGTINLLAIAWVLLRLAYGFIYLADWGTARTVVWGAALACAVALFFVGA